MSLLKGLRWAEMNKNILVGLIVDKLEVYSLHLASYTQMTNRKP
jgi:hypothetical protein